MYNLDAHKALDEGSTFLVAALISRLSTEPKSLHRAQLNGEEFWGWSRTEYMIADLIDEVRILRAIQTAKPKQLPKWDNYPRPQRRSHALTLDDAFADLTAMLSGT